MRDSKGALRRYQRSYALDPEGNHRALGGMAAALANLNRYELAKWYIARAIATAPAEAREQAASYWSIRGRILERDYSRGERVSRLEKAERAFAEAVRLDPEYLPYREGLERVRFTLKGVRVLDPEVVRKVEEHIRRGVRLLDNGLLENALHEFNEACLLHLSSALAHYLAGLTCRRLAAETETLGDVRHDEYMRRSRETTDPEESERWRLKAIAAIEGTGRMKSSWLERAENYLKVACLNEPRDVKCRLDLARVQWDRDEITEAVTTLLGIIRDDPAAAEAHKHLAGGYRSVYEKPAQAEIHARDAERLGLKMGEEFWARLKEARLKAARELENPSPTASDAPAGSPSAPPPPTPSAASDSDTRERGGKLKIRPGENTR